MQLHAGQRANLTELSEQDAATFPRTDRRVLVNTGALVGSSLWRIGISFFLQFLIANRLGAAGLGQYATALAYLNVSQVLTELGLTQLLVRDLAHSPERRLVAFRTAMAMRTTAALLIWGALAGLTFLLPYQPQTRYTLIVMTASLPLYAMSSVYELLFQASERMEPVMGIGIVTNTVIVVASIGVLWSGGTVVHLAAVIIGAQAVSILLCVVLLRRSGLLDEFEQAPAEHSLWVASLLLWRNARPFFALSLANVMLHRLDILLLSVVGGEVITGIYSAAYLVVRVFVILGQTFWQALYPTLSRLHQQTGDQYRRLASLGVRYGIVALLPVAALGGAVAQPVLGLIFRGDLYQQSVPIFRVLVWSAPLFFVSVYAVNLLLIERKPGQSLAIAVVHLVIIAVTLPILTALMSAIGAAFAMLIAIAASAGTGVILLHRTGLPVQLPLRPQLFAGTILAGGVVYYLHGLLPPSTWLLALCIGGFVYVAVIWWSGLVSVKDLNLFRRALRPL